MRLNRQIVAKLWFLTALSNRKYTVKNSLHAPLVLGSVVSTVSFILCYELHCCLFSILVKDTKAQYRKVQYGIAVG
jgi:hypothetical protein